MTRWWWVRHGPTHAKEFVGWRDLPADLSDTARIARLSTHLPAPAILVSSDLSRAIATADALAEGRHRLPHAPAIREFNFGLWDGLGFDAVAARDPELSRRFWENPGDVAPPEGESWNEVAARVAGFIEEISARHAGQDIIAVAHIGVIMTAIATASGARAEEVLAERIDNLSVTRLDLGKDGWSVGGINTLP